MSIKNVLLKSFLVKNQDKIIGDNPEKTNKVAKIGQSLSRLVHSTGDNPEEINIQDDPEEILEAKEGSNTKASPNWISSICQYYIF